MKLLLLVVIFLLAVVNCSRILFLFPTPSPSHYFLGNVLARGLAEAGHDVTMISAFKDENPPERYREVILTGMLEEFRRQQRVKFFEMEHMNPLLSLLVLNQIGMMMANYTLEHPNFQNFIQTDQHFDVVIIEQFLNDALKALAHHYKAPLILVSVGGASTWVNPLAGSPSPFSYIPAVHLGYSSSMSFKERLFNSVYRTLEQLNYDFILTPAQNKLMKKHFPDAPDLNVANYNASLFLLNSHESTNQPVPYVPRMIDIGGFHVNSSKQLPKDLQEFMDDAKEGVVYFSMGSNIKPSEMTEETRDQILRSLGKLKQKVLWKWDEDTLPGKPDNVKLSKWFPQQEILAHPNTKLFITHGGLLSITETVYHGVPILTFPIFADQKLNARRAEMIGIGLTVPFSQITEEKLNDVLDKLLNNSSYQDAAKLRSKFMKDRPVKPLDLAIYWVEFVIRHRGTPHLSVAALDLPWYQYFLLDVIAFIALIGVGVLVITCTLIKRIFCKATVKAGKLKKN